ncbi:MAG TPA: 5-(carboxyamino)imidazole ribonucleotide mutase [Syntrophorhabdales bacterium]|nr:5-(carboxyamino)imidazole ribonucleotide mutase [Syntrophorhabdales bacterium]
MTAPRILIILGSDSDLPIIEDGLNFLKTMDVAYALDISSAHRHPEKTVTLAQKARGQGIEVIIAAAGLAAHLPGVIASHTTLPVIGIPLKGEALNGLDSLLSIVQMPKGVPVATVGVNSSRNACILACEILSIKYPQISRKMELLKETMRNEVEQKSRKIAHHTAKVESPKRPQAGTGRGSRKIK